MFDILGLDWGSKKIGVAICDCDNQLIIPQQPLLNLKNIEIIEAINKIIKKYNIKQILIGYPNNFKLEKTQTSEKIDTFIQTVLLKLRNIENITINKVFERSTTKNANKILDNFGDNKINEDSVSAMLIIKNFLNI